MKLPPPGIVIILLASALPIAAQVGDNRKAPKPATLIVKDFLGKERVINDFDDDGWDDLWCAIFPDIEHRNRVQDTDGDGLTDYEEMVMWRNPFAAEPFPRELTPEEIAEAKAAAEAEHLQAVWRWNDRVAAARAAGVRELITPEKPENDSRIAALTLAIGNLELEAARATAEAPAKLAAWEAKAKELGIPLYQDTGDGGKILFGGQTGDGAVIFTGSHNRVAGASVSAHKLWPQAAAPWLNTGLSGLNLTGAGQTVAIWENDGGVRTAHQAFGGRVIQRDGAALDITGHATEVAGTLAGSGFANAAATGVAYQSSIEAFDISNLAVERVNAVAGNYGGQILTIGNNSWGLLNGWSHGTVTSGGQQITRWFWYGDPAFGAVEDPKFGRYTQAIFPANYGSVEYDQFVRSAPHHLPVFSSGNDRRQGPDDAYLKINGVPTPAYFTYVNGSLTSLNPWAVARNWNDGDADGYDTIVAPSTAKNVLTVGACLDITHMIGGVPVPGFGPGSAVNPARFSGAGPTDDGRIKPDLVAVGDTSLGARTALGVASTPGLVTPTSSSNSAYQTQLSTGTSFAAPAVSGGLALVLQRRKQLYPSLPANDLWLASTLKAIAINGVDDPGAPGPDYRLGHGVFNAAKSVAIVDDDYAAGRGTHVKEFTLEPFETVSWKVTVAGGQPLAITAAWNDPAGPGQPYSGAPDNAAAVLVNNIDIELKNLATHEIIYPWVLNPDFAGKSASVRGAAAIRSIDFRNNVERISAEFPTPGTYLVTVKHSGGIAGTAAAQAVSVVLTNAAPEMARIKLIEASPNLDEFIIHYTSNPDAYYDLETSVDLVNWTTSGTLLAEATENTVLVPTGSSDPRRFWKLRRSQQ